MTAGIEDHSGFSSLREKLLEHIFISELLKVLWRSGRRDMEVARSEIDNGGYDLVLDCKGVTRHVQLKTSYNGSKTARQNINLNLLKKTSGCVVWMKFDKGTLALGPFYWLGGVPGKRLPDISAHKIAKHTKGNAEGVKAERRNHRVIPQTSFTKIDDMDGLVRVLFG